MENIENIEKNPSVEAKSEGATGGAARGRGRSRGPRRDDRRPVRGEREKEEFDQKTVDLARVTRVMAGGKRMRFRACVVIGDRKGRVGVGVAKGADVTLATQKAFNQAKKVVVDVPLVNGTIPHEIYCKEGAAKLLLRPARAGRGVIAGGATRIVLELAGVRDITSKNLGTNNKVNVVKCAIKALESLKRVERHAKPKQAVEAVSAEAVVETKSEEPKRKAPARKPAADKSEAKPKQVRKPAAKKAE